MKRTIENLINEMEGKLSGYAGLLHYRYLNLCVKAEPIALLSIQLEDEEGDPCNLEKMADVFLADKYTYEVIPKKPKYVFNICKGFKEVHPELEQEIITPDDNARLHTDQNDEKHIRFKVPEVNKDRYDYLMDAVKVLYDQCKVQVDKVNADYSVKLAPKIVGLSEEEIEEAKVKLEDSQAAYKGICDKYLAIKQKEIEEAYQHYLDEQTSKKAQEDEIEATRVNRLSNSIKMGSYED